MESIFDTAGGRFHVERSRCQLDKDRQKNKSQIQLRISG
jgi:hypothetical protein